MYTEKVMDHFMHPRNVGEIENASGVGTVGNAKCGDIMRIYLDIDENQVVRDAKFKTFGCGAAIATSSMATEMIIGKTIQEALEVTNKAVMEALGGLPPVKVHCSLLAEQAVHAALWDYAKKNNIVIEGLKPPVNDVDELDHDGEEEYRRFRRSIAPGSVPGDGAALFNSLCGRRRKTGRRAGRPVQMHGMKAAAVRTKGPLWRARRRSCRRGGPRRRWAGAAPRGSG